MQEAASSASKGAPRAEGFELDLIGSQGAWVAASSLLLGLASGQLVTVNLQADGGTVKRIKVCHRLRCPAYKTLNQYDKDPQNCYCEVDTPTNQAIGDRTIVPRIIGPNSASSCHWRLVKGAKSARCCTYCSRLVF